MLHSLPCLGDSMGAVLAYDALCYSKFELEDPVFKGEFLIACFL